MSATLAEIPIRPGHLSDIPAFADAFRRMWLDNGIASDQIEPDYRERVDPSCARASVASAMETPVDANLR